MTVANVLIIVDVQNCFVKGGSFGGDTKNKALIDEIADIVTNVPIDYYVVTRDIHPAHHQSHFITSGEGKVKVKRKSNGAIVNVPEGNGFLGSIDVPGFDPVETLGGPWPPHCRATPDEIKQIGKCAPRTNKGEVDVWNPSLNNIAGKTNRFKKTNNGKPIIGTKVSHFYDQRTDVDIFNKFKNPDMKLSLLDRSGEQNKQPSETEFQFNVASDASFDDGHPPVLEVLKGQLCGWDAYSAFQYHANFAKGPLINDEAGDLAHTTGLAEVLFSNEFGISAFKKDVTQVNIIVCGLVGEVCIKYSVSYGLNLLLRAKQSGGGLTGYGRINTGDKNPKLTAAPIPNVNFVYSSYGTRFIPKPIIISGPYGILAEITGRIAETGVAPESVGLSYKMLLNEDAAVNDGPSGFTTADINGALVTQSGGRRRKGSRRTMRRRRVSRRKSSTRKH